MKASCSNHSPGSVEQLSPWSGFLKNARSWRGDAWLLAPPGGSQGLLSRHPSMDAARAGNVLADQFLCGSPADHAGIQLHAPGDLRWRGAWIYSRALCPILRSALPGNPAANFPVVAGVHGYVSGAGLPRRISDRAVGTLAAPIASVGGTAVLDQLSGPNLCHDLSAAGHRTHQ